MKRHTHLLLCRGMTTTKRMVARLILLILLALKFSACAPGMPAAWLTPMTVATVPTGINALLYIAEAQNFFASKGLQVTLKEDYDSGATAATAMLNGEADVATAAEFPIVRQVFNKKDITSFRYEDTFILWRADSGIQTIEDLQGKKIDVTLQTISAFYLGRTLDLNGMNIQQVTLVDLKAADAEKALANREVDAVVTWEPWATQISQHMGNEVIAGQLQSSQYAYWNLVGTTGWVNEHPDTIEGLIRSMVQAEEYIAGHPNEANGVVGKRMNFEDAYLEMIWDRYQFSVSLDQSLILAMEDEARWMIANNLPTETDVPDFLDYIYLDGLEAVKPNAVNLIR